MMYKSNYLSNIEDYFLKGESRMSNIVDNLVDFHNWFKITGNRKLTRYECKMFSMKSCGYMGWTNPTYVEMDHLVAFKCEDKSRLIINSHYYNNRNDVIPEHWKKINPLYNNGAITYMVHYRVITFNKFEFFDDVEYLAHCQFRPNSEGYHLAHKDFQALLRGEPPLTPHGE